MILPVSKRMASVKPSPTGAVLALAAELRAAGRDVISLGAGEPDFDTPAHIREAAVVAINGGQTRYTPTDGTAELKAAIQAKLSRENQLDYPLSQIVVTSGAKQALFNLCMALFNPGNQAIIPAPYWVSYPDMVRLADGEPVVIETGLEQHFKITPEQLAAAITERTRLLILNNPSNPTGACYSEAEMAALGAVVEQHPDIVVLSDDIYEHIHWAPEPFVSFATACPALMDRTVTTNGVSKAYAMTGWRIGYAAGPQELITAMKTVQSQSTTNACSVSQAAAVAALNGDQACVRDMATAYHERHDFFVGALNSIDGFECRHSEGTFYAFPRIQAVLDARGMADDTEFVEFLLNKAEVACVPGSAFGAPGYVRFSFACSLDMLEESVQRIKRALAA